MVGISEVLLIIYFVLSVALESIMHLIKKEENKKHPFKNWCFFHFWVGLLIGYGVYKIIWTTLKSLS